jgi:uncharacterized membrane protein YdcZ (DUF606 family)
MGMGLVRTNKLFLFSYVLSLGLVGCNLPGSKNGGAVTIPKIGTPTATSSSTPTTPTTPSTPAPPANQAPTITSGACPNSVAQNSAYMCDVNATDPENTTIVYSFISSTCAWAQIDSVTGLIQGRPNDDQVGSCAMQVKVTDAGGMSAMATYPVGVTNIAPTLAIGNTSVAQNAALAVVRSDADVAASDEGYGIYSLVAPTGTACSANGQLTINSANGAVSFKPNTGYVGTCNAKVRFDDGNPPSNIAESQFSIAVASTNRAPVLAALNCTASINQDANFTCNASATDADGNALTFKASAGNTCAWATVAANGVITGKPRNNQVGACTLGVAVSDGFLEVAGTQTITVVNLAPTLTIGNATIQEDAALTVVRADADVQANEEGFGGTYTLATPVGLACSANGSVQINPMNGAVSYQPAANFSGNCFVRVRFNDGNTVNNTVDAEFQIAVTSVNDAPTISLANCVTSVNQDAIYSCQSVASDPENSALTYSFGATHTCAWITSIGSAGLTMGRPTDNQVGTCVLSMTVSDGTLTANATKTITVVNVKPVLTLSDVSIQQGALAADIKADADVQASEEGLGAYSLITPTSGTACSTVGTISINAQSGIIRFQPINTFSGACTVNVQFNDGNTADNLVNAQFNVNVVAMVIASNSLDSIPAFEKTLYVVTRSRCVGCHASTYSPLHAAPVVATAHDAALTKVDFANVPASRIATKVASGHNCWSGNCTADAKVIEDAVREWLRIKKLVVVAPPVVDIPASFNCTDPNSPAPERLRRLTDAEIQATLKDILGDTIYAQVAGSVGLLPSDKINKSISEFSNAHSIAHLDGLVAIAERVATVVVGNTTYRAQILGSCTNVTPISDQCITAVMNDTFGFRVLRRPPTSAEVTGILTALGPAAGRNADSLKLLVMRLLLAPSFAFFLEPGDTMEDYMGVTRLKLTPYEVANRISYGTIGSLPDATLYAAAKANQLQTIAQVKAQVERLMATPRYLERLDQWTEYWLQFIRIPDATGSVASAAPVTSVGFLRSQALQELKAYVRHMVVTRQGSYPDMMSSTEIFPLGYVIADVYGVQPIGAGAPPIAGSPDRQGLLTRPGMLLSGNDGTSIIQRGVFIRRNLLCDDIPAPDPVTVAMRSTQAQLSHLQYSNRAVQTNFTTTATNCASCHQKIDHLGFAFEDWDGIGRKRAQERYFMDGMVKATYPIDTRVTPEIDVGDGLTFDNGVQLGMAIATSSKGTACFARQLFRYNKLRFESVADSCALKAAQDELTKNGGTGKLKDAVIGNIANPLIFYRRLN